jgi:ketosteroid isomerase-like protein
MTDRKTIEAVIERCYAARQKGDIETLMAAFDPDAVFGLAGSKELVPATEPARGHQNIRDTMTGSLRSSILSIATSSAWLSTASMPPCIRA